MPLLSPATNPCSALQGSRTLYPGGSGGASHTRRRTGVRSASEPHLDEYPSVWNMAPLTPSASLDSTRG